MAPLLTLLLLPFLAADGVRPTDDANSAYRQAEEHYHADRPARAEPLYLTALSSSNAFTRRRAYDRLISLYIQSGRPDKAIRLAEGYRTWLRELKDTVSLAHLEIVVAECNLSLGLYDQADKGFDAGLALRGDLTSNLELRARRGKAELAAALRSPDEKKRWAELAAAAVAARKRAVELGDPPLRIAADRARADALHFQGDTKAALELLADLPAIHDKLADPLGRRDTQRHRANLLAASKNYDAAIPAFTDALSLHRKLQPHKRLVAGDILSDWSMAATAAGRRDEAAKLRDEAAREYQAVITVKSSDDQEVESRLQAFARLQQLTRSSRQFRKALDLARDAGERWSGDDILAGRIKADRGAMELLAASYPVARDLLNAALVRLDQTDPPDLRAIGQVLVNLAAAELALGGGDRAERLLTRCAEMYRTRRLPADPIRAECEYLRGATAAQRGRFAEAIALFRSGLTVCDTVGTLAEPVRFNLLLNIALIHKEQGDLAAATTALEQAAKSLALFAEAADISTGLIAAVRADLHLSDGKVREAASLLPDIEAACIANGITGGYLVTTIKHVRGMDKLLQRKPAEAEKIWQELADQQRKEGQLLLARTLNYLGIAADLQGHTSDAQRLFEEARAFQNKNPRCPPVARCVTSWRLAVLADRAGKTAEAKKLAAEVFDIADATRLNTFGEAAQRATFFAQFNPIFELLADWHARDGEAEGLLRVITRSRSRTLLDQILAAGVDPRDRLTGPDRDKILAREAAARQAVSQLRARAQFLPEGTKPEIVQQAIAELESAQKEYADSWKEIVNADPVTRVLTDRGLTDNTPTGLPKSAAESKTAVLAYLIGRDNSYAVLSPAPNQKAEIYRLGISRQLAEGVGDVPGGVAKAVEGRRGLVIEPIAQQPEAPGGMPDAKAVSLTGPVTLRLVDHYLRQISDPRFNPTRGIVIEPRTRERPLKAMTSAALGDAILPAALLERLKSARPDRLVVIPDGALHKVPIECLLVSAKGGPRYAIDELPAICYAPSPAILQAVMTRAKPAGKHTLLTASDPLYGDEATTGVVASSRDLTVLRGSLPRLPFTSVESRRVREGFPASEVTAFEREGATERAVVAAIEGKRYVHLAAHGFADSRFGNLFAAVALSPPRGTSTTTADDDGFLSLHEIHRLRMADCELTVLSACTTNVGPQRPLEAGVTLANAFLCAGSRRVMASCWSVDDKATSELISLFFQSVGPGKENPAGYAAALKSARSKVRATPGWEAPFYWAPFVLVGSPD